MNSKNKFACHTTAFLLFTLISGALYFTAQVAQTGITWTLLGILTLAAALILTTK